MNAKFHLPGMTTHFYLNILFIDLVKRSPELFRDGVEIASVYGTVPPALWNGGRVVRGSYSASDAEYLVSSYNSRNIPVRFTFTNPMIEERHLSDKFCNQICRIAENEMNEIIIFSPMLEKYLRKTYPKFTYTSSTCKQLTDTEELKKELEGDYRLVVLDYNFNNDFDFLESLPHKEKCEFLLNAICVSNCRFRSEHYRYLGKQQIYVNELLPIAGADVCTIVPKGEKKFECPYNTSLESGLNQKTYISPEAVYEKYIPMGFNNFKIEGRTYPGEHMLEEYIRYMAKPECADAVRKQVYSDLEESVR